jgi:hypothetical protein
MALAADLDLVPQNTVECQNGMNSHAVFLINHRRNPHVFQLLLFFWLSI